MARVELDERLPERAPHDGGFEEGSALPLPEDGRLGDVPCRGPRRVRLGLD
jgi:hypothetical protein